MKKRPQVALLIEMSNAYARGLLRGIRRYVNERPGWSIFMPEQSRGDAPPAWLKSWDGDGIIARIESQRIATAVLATELPAVDVSAAGLAPRLPVVETNDPLIAQLAFEHLRERGFRQLGYCGDDRFAWSRRRSETFVRLAAEANLACSEYRPKGLTANSSWKQQQQQLSIWLRRLPKPVGVMACYDLRACQVLEVCRRLGLSVPDEVAVIGVDNDDLMCDLSEPPLSSVIPDADRTGFEAASLLDQMLQGKQVPAKSHWIEPLGIATRRSTDVFAILDDDVSKALKMIREQACDGINVEAVVGRLAVSRRALESRFKRLLGRTPHEEIVRLQMDRVKQLLLETDLPLTIVAERAGFRHVEYLSAAFKTRIGESPSEFRRQRRR